MPTYSYRCGACGHSFDVQQSITEPSLTACPSCGGNLRKLYAPVGVTFNGSGFYRTDSRPAGASGATPSNGSNTSSTPPPASTAS